jgi:hypothetical protein
MTGDDTTLIPTMTLLRNKIKLIQTAELHDYLDTVPELRVVGHLPFLFVT